jgi:hypothetical protein
MQDCFGLRQEIHHEMRDHVQLKHGAAHHMLTCVCHKVVQKRHNPNSSIIICRSVISELSSSRTSQFSVFQPWRTKACHVLETNSVASYPVPRCTDLGHNGIDHPLQLSELICCTHGACQGTNTFPERLLHRRTIS